MVAVDKGLLAAMAAEATEARRRLDLGAAAVGDWVAALPPDRRAAALGGAQAFDEIGQRLGVLASLIEGLARGDDPARLIAEVPLADMARRLLGAPPSASVASGDLTLFE